MSVDSEEIYLGFGKFATTELGQVPSSYLRYLQEQEWFYDKEPTKAEKVEREMEFRDRWDSHFEETPLF